MKSVGEVMAIGRTFAEALQKACRSLETGRDGLGNPAADPAPGAPEADPEALLALRPADRRPAGGGRAELG